MIAASFPTDAEGAPLSGYVQVATTSGGALILDASRDAALPDGAGVLSEGAGRYARAALGTHADRVLECRWERNDERGHEKISAALSRNPTVTITQSDLPPHEWMGENS
jgi:hypothetical protein